MRFQQSWWGFGRVLKGISIQPRVDERELTIVKLALPFSLTVTGSVTSSSPFKSSNKRWACLGYTP